MSAYGPIITLIKVQLFLYGQRHTHVFPYATLDSVHFLHVDNALVHMISSMSSILCWPGTIVVASTSEAAAFKVSSRRYLLTWWLALYQTPNFFNFLSILAHELICSVWFFFFKCFIFPYLMTCCEAYNNGNLSFKIPACESLSCWLLAEKSDTALVKAAAFKTISQSSCGLVVEFFPCNINYMNSYLSCENHKFVPSLLVEF